MSVYIVEDKISSDDMIEALWRYEGENLFFIATSESGTGVAGFDKNLEHFIVAESMENAIGKLRKMGYGESHRIVCCYLKSKVF